MYTRIIAIILSITSLIGCTPTETKPEQTLKSALTGNFLIGTAMNTAQITGDDTRSDSVIAKHFNSIVAENCMKSEIIQPREGKFDFTLADQFVDFGKKHNMFIIGHTLIWHSQAPDWFFKDDDGNDVSREVLISRMKNHIYKIVGRYKGIVHGWDVVNEAFEDDGTYRKSKFYTIIGEDFIPLAFQFAREADPGAELYYNDYSMVKEGKQKAVIQLVNQLKNDGLRIDAVGMQGHYSLTYPTIKAFETGIENLAAAGVNVMITELDISVIPSPYEIQGADVANRFAYSTKMDPFKDGLPDSIQKQQNERYLQFFNTCLKHADNISRVTLWGVNDLQSWRNNWPIPGRTDYPLLFDRQNKAKPIVEEIIKAAKTNQSN